uniref:Uncharacterized protein n=1 Tax=viral metagenome TaxID=1070528 RepID=A0A6H1ZCI8_9ZZZZ
MKLKRKIDELEALVLVRFSDLEEGLKRIIARGEIVSILKEELDCVRGEKKELLNRLMARDFETFQTYTAGGQEEAVGEDLKPEEDADMAGEVFAVKS